jgi:cytochrome P450
MDVDPESRTTVLPPGPRLSGPVLTLAYAASRQRFFAAMQRRYGSVFTLNLPPFGPSVVVCDAALCKQLFMTSPDIAGNTSPNLGNVLGAGSTFALDGAPHRARRKLMVPPFHGRRLKAYEGLIEEEVMRTRSTRVRSIPVKPAITISGSVVVSEDTASSAAGCAVTAFRDDTAS